MVLETYPEARVPTQREKLTPYTEMQNRDDVLIKNLKNFDEAREASITTPWELTVRNTALAPLLHESYTPATFIPLHNILKEKGAFDLHIRNGHMVTIGGEESPVVAIAATETETNGDMSAMVWIRDQTQAGKSLFEIWRHNPEKYEAEGKAAKEVILSSLHLMSTDAQLDRFNNIISSDDPKFKADYLQWPQIAIGFDKLESNEPTNWRHKQEAWQMLGITVLDALDTDLINVEDLADGHKKFLGSIVPFLESVDFTNQPNSGSWEELEAVRTSVIGVETALLDKVKKHADKPGFAFLKAGFRDEEFATTIDAMIERGLRKIGEQLPYEAPGYDKASPKYREADATLLYLLDYDIPQLLKQKIPVGPEQKMLSRREIEEMILHEVGKLYDPATNGIIRYGAEGDANKDTYEGINYHTDGMQHKIKDMKARLKAEAGEDAPIDLDKKFSWRQEIVPPGNPAAWTHFNAQISSWAGRRYLETQDPWYLDIATETFNRTIATMTGEGEHYTILNGQGQHVIKEAPAYRLPECWTTFQTDTKEKFVVPSTHIPLNWAVAKSTEATALLSSAVEKKEQLATVGV